ncbi:MAG: type 1 periplasmic binding fold superfamily protein [Flavobacteriaceae bacterium]|nr:type 1 periplasmic binding fold superfamily protein [Flavobacteriaceae bacterium]
MKTFKYLTLLFVTTLFIACNNDDDSNPDPVNEEEVITTMTITLEPTGAGTQVVMQTRDIDGPDGPEPPVVTVVGELVVGATYNGSVAFLNETETPPENINEEIEEEDDEHQIFYIAGGGLDVTTAYTDQDGDGNPLGLTFTLTANTAGSGTMTVILRHEPTKPNDGTPADAGGETDIAETFDVTIN